MISKVSEPYCHSFHVGYCKNNSFSACQDGSKDTGVQKMNHAAVRRIAIKNSEAVSEHSISMCQIEGEDAGKASNNFEGLEESFEADEKT